VPSLGTREVLAFGEGVALPARMTFGQLPDHLIPSSEAVRNTYAESGHPAPQELVEMIIARWRGASSSNKRSLLDETAHPSLSPNGGVASQPSPRTSVLDRSSILKKNAVLADNSPTKPRKMMIGDDPTRFPI